MNWLLLLEVVLGVVCLWFTYVYVDVQRKKRMLEARGLTVYHQLFQYNNVFVNLFPRSEWAMWLFPFRIAGLDTAWVKRFKETKKHALGFVSFQFYEVFLEYVLFVLFIFILFYFLFCINKSTLLLPTLQQILTYPSCSLFLCLFLFLFLSLSKKKYSVVIQS